MVVGTNDNGMTYANGISLKRPIIFRSTSPGPDVIDSRSRCRSVGLTPAQKILGRMSQTIGDSYNYKMECITPHGGRQTASARNSPCPSPVPNGRSTSLERCRSELKVFLSHDRVPGLLPSPPKNTFAFKGKFIAHRLVAFQAKCRGYLARKKYADLRVFQQEQIERWQKLRDENSGYKQDISQLELLIEELKRELEIYHSCKRCGRKRRRMVEGDDYESEDESEDEEVKLQRVQKEAVFYQEQVAMLNEELKTEHTKAQTHFDDKVTSLVEKVEKAQEKCNEEVQKSVTLTGELQKVSVQLSSAEDKNKEMERKVKRLKEEVKKVNQNILEEMEAKEDAVQEREELIRENNFLEKRNQDMRAELDTQKEQLVVLNGQVSELSSSHSQLRRLEQDLSAARQACQSAESRCRELEFSNEESRDFLSELEMDKSRLETSMTKLRQQYNRALAEHEDELETMRAANHRRLTSLQDQLDVETKQREDAVRAARDLERRMSIMRVGQDEDDDDDDSASRVDQEQKYRREVLSLKNLLEDERMKFEQYKMDHDVNGMQNKIFEYETELDTVTREKNSLSAELSMANTKVTTLTVSNTESENRLRQLTKEKNSLSTRLTSKESECEDLRHHLEEATSQAGQERQLLVTQSRDLEGVTEERDRLRREMHELRTKLETEVTKVNEENVRFATSIKELKTARTKERKEWTAHMDKVTEEAESIQLENESLQTTMESDKARLKKLQRQLAEEQERADEAERKTKEAERRLAEVNYELDMAKAQVTSSLDRRGSWTSGHRLQHGVSDRCLSDELRESMRGSRSAKDEDESSDDDEPGTSSARIRRSKSSRLSKPSLSSQSVMEMTSSLHATEDSVFGVEED